MHGLRQAIQQEDTGYKSEPTQEQIGFRLLWPNRIPSGDELLKTQMNRDRVYRRFERKPLTAHKVERLWKFKRDDVDQWVRQGKAAEDAENR